MQSICSKTSCKTSFKKSAIFGKNLGNIWGTLSPSSQSVSRPPAPCTVDNMDVLFVMSSIHGWGFYPIHWKSRWQAFIVSCEMGRKLPTITLGWVVWQFPPTGVLLEGKICKQKARSKSQPAGRDFPSRKIDNLWDSVERSNGTVWPDFHIYFAQFIWLNIHFESDYIGHRESNYITGESGNDKRCRLINFEDSIACNVSSLVPTNPIFYLTFIYGLSYYQE